MSGRLRVAINAQLQPGGGAGGIETVLIALTALARLDDGAEEYIFIGPAGEPDWLLRPWLGSRARIVPGLPPAPPSLVDETEKRGAQDLLRRAARRVRPAAGRLKRYLSAQESGRTQQRHAAERRNFFERLDCDVVHFPYQYFEPCAMPTIFNPHDLQHLHHPSFFAEAEIERRETTYAAACRGAHTVVVASQFVKQDVVEHYGVSADRVQVVAWSPPPAPLAAGDADAAQARGSDASGVAEEYRPSGLAGRAFALYPAMTWEHKNHLRLLEALALLRDRLALEVAFVCTGHKTEFWPRIERRICELRLQNQVAFTGLIPYAELSALYRAAQFVFVPTLFEAASAPLFEAWQHNVPVACSRVTSLPEQAGDAALLFDPTSVESIADALARMATSAELRDDLRRRGALRLRDFSPERTAKAYRAIYRRAAGRTLGEEDRWLLGKDEAAHAAPHASVEVQRV